MVLVSFKCDTTLYSAYFGLNQLLCVVCCSAIFHRQRHKTLDYPLAELRCSQRF